MKFIILSFFFLTAICWLWAVSWWKNKYGVSEKEKDVIPIILAYVGAIVGTIILIK